MNLEVAFFCITRDSDASLTTAVEDNVAKIISVYPETTIIASQDTCSQTIEVLRDGGCRVRIQPGRGVGDARREVLRTALREKIGHIHLCDLDRALHWANTYLKELKSLRCLIPKRDLLILERTPRAFETHPRPQRVTESITNQVFSLVIGRHVDVNAASRGISHRAARILLEHSRAPGFETDVEWPLIIKLRSNLNIGYLEVEGLEYETHLKHRGAIRDAGGIGKWKSLLEKDPEEWLKRVRVAQSMIEASIKVHRELTCRRAE